jgi:hypothetical protein
MNILNSSTGFSPFQLQMRHSPHVIPPLIYTDLGVMDICASSVVERLCLDVLEAKDNMLQAKISQFLTTNEHRSNDFPFRKGDCVVLSMLHSSKTTSLKVKCML